MPSRRSPNRPDRREDVVDACVVRQAKAYPVYDDSYRDNLAMIRLDLNGSYPTLHLVGRNGMHKYNNQDHAMMTAMLTARNIIAGERIYDVWDVNEDAEYHEAGASGMKEALRSERLVPQKIKLARGRDGGRMPPPRLQSRVRSAARVELICFALCVAQFVYLACSFVQGSWIFDPDGERIATDFVNVWASGRQALDGGPAAVYDADCTRRAEVAAVGHPFGREYPWIYPPTFLFVARFARVSSLCSRLMSAWIALTFPPIWQPCAPSSAHRAGILLACAYPGILSNLVVGQNGFVTAGLLGGSLLLLQRRPVLAGCLIGLLSFKPHLGILFPLALIAGGNGAPSRRRRQ